MRILVYGDMRFTDPHNTSATRPGVRKWLAQQVGEQDPDILMLTGDMPYHGIPADWSVYERETASWRARHFLIYPTLGNHEVLPNRKRGLAYYFEAYPQLHGHAWYSVEIGNLYLIVLDSTDFLSPGYAQRAWLDAQLAHLPPQTDFVFFLSHIPLVSDLQTAFLIDIFDPPAVDLRKDLENWAAHSRAQFVIFSGHIHNYERFDMNGIMHVITGGGGAKPYRVFVRGNQDLYRDRTDPNFNFVEIALEGKRAQAKMYRVEDPYTNHRWLKVRDTFTLRAK